MPVVGCDTIGYTPCNWSQGEVLHPSTDIGTRLIGPAGPHAWQKSIYGLLVFVARQHHRSVVTQSRSSRIRI